uniref:Uncharacterized protein n=1 Tax=viral metagenome TaxID=1070528 RepID=A0A6H1Z8U0_9ZZZZ
MLNGRISPHVSAYDPTADLYPYEAYGTYGGAAFLFCLGEDTVLPVVHAYQEDMAISVEQQFDIGVAQKLLQFCWDVSQPEGMPGPRTIISAGEVSFMLGSLITTGDGATGIIVRIPGLPFTAADRGKLVRISGATDVPNNNDFMIDGIPADQGQAAWDRAVVYDAAMVARMNDPAVTVKVLGLRWVTRVYVDTGLGPQEKIAYTEEIGHRKYRNYMALHLSKFVGTLTARFEAKLEAYE